MEKSNAASGRAAGNTTPPPEPGRAVFDTALARSISPMENRTQVAAQDTENAPQQNDSAARQTVAAGPVTAVASGALRTFIVDGVVRQCESVAVLLDEPQLRHKFQDSFALYFDFPYPDEPTLRRRLSMQSNMEKAFLLINEIKELFDEETKPVPDAKCESTLYNPQMITRGERALSLTLHGASRHADFLRQFPHREIDSLNVADAGLYLCMAEKKLVCHACGGAINRWDSEWQYKSLKEVHAKLFPNCSFLQAECGQEFIDRCQQSVAAGQEAAPCILDDCANFYALPPGKEQIEAEREVRDYLALLHRLSHPMDNRKGTDAYLLSSVELMIDLLRPQFMDILPDLSLQQLFDQFVSHIKKVPRVCWQTTLNLLQIQQDLLMMPRVVREEIVAQLFELQRTTDESSLPAQLVDRIRAMMIFVRSQRKMATPTDRTDPCRQLITLKAFFNESALFRVLYNRPVRKQSFPIQPAWSIASRCQLHQLLSDQGCHLTTDIVNDTNPRLIDDRGGNPSMKRLIQLALACQQSIGNQADFIDFIVKTATSEKRFVPLLVEQDNCTADAVDSLLDPRTERDLLNLEHFLAELVRKHWDKIMLATTRQ